MITLKLPSTIILFFFYITILTQTSSIDQIIGIQYQGIYEKTIENVKIIIT